MKMPEISRQQKQYLARQKKEKHIILAARTLLFVLFMGLWEISSDLGCFRFLEGRNSSGFSGIPEVC